MPLNSPAEFFDWLRIVIVGGFYLMWESIKKCFSGKK